MKAHLDYYYAFLAPKFDLDQVLWLSVIVMVADQVPWAKRSVRKHVFFVGGPFEWTVERRIITHGVLFLGVSIAVRVFLKLVSSVDDLDIYLRKGFENSLV